MVLTTFLPTKFTKVNYVYFSIYKASLQSERKKEMTKFNYSENVLLDGQELLEARDKYEGNLLKSRAWYKKLLCIDLPSYDLRPYWKKMLRRDNEKTTCMSPKPQISF